MGLFRPLLPIENRGRWTMADDGQADDGDDGGRWSSGRWWTMIKRKMADDGDGQTDDSGRWPNRRLPYPLSSVWPRDLNRSDFVRPDRTGPGPDRGPVLDRTGTPFGPDRGNYMPGQFVTS